MYSTNDQTVCIIGIDPGTVLLGYAEIYFNLRTMEVVKCSAKTISAYECYQSRLYNTVERQSDLDPTDRIELIVYNVLRRLRNIDGLYAMAVEDPFFNRRMPGAFGPLLTQVNFIKSETHIHYPYIDVKGFAPMTIKASVGAKSMKGKEPMYIAVLYLLVII